MIPSGRELSVAECEAVEYIIHEALESLVDAQVPGLIREKLEPP